MEKFRIDFTKINLLELKNIGILPKDITVLFGSEYSEFTESDNFFYAIGYLRQGRFIHALYDVSKNFNFDIEILEIGNPNEEDIKEYWCKSRKKN